MSGPASNRIPEQAGVDHEEAPAAKKRQPLESYQQCAVDSVREHPLAATLIGFGLGVCVGTALGSLIDDPRTRRHQDLAHSLGRRLADSLGEILPASLNDHLKS